jgi:hypothetical protein
MMPTQLAEVMHDFGERWEITQGAGCWIAVRRPTPTSLRVIAAHGLAELRDKLARAERA